MMTLTSVAIFLCGFVAFTSALCTPDQWEGIEGSIGGYIGRRSHGLIKQYLYVAYDATNQRTAAFLNYESREYSNKFWIVVRYEDNKGSLYVVDLKTQKCWKKSIERSFRKACIPDKAKSIGDYYIGLSGGFKVTGYELPGERIKAFISVQKTDNDQFVPIGESVYGKIRNVEFLQNVGFINITQGIKNETIFDVPSECEKREDFTLAEELTREHYILAI